MKKKQKYKKESNKESDKESDKKSDKESNKESIKEKQYLSYIKKQRTFANLSKNETINMASKLWFPNKVIDIFDYVSGEYIFENVHNINTNSWFKMTHIISLDDSYFKNISYNPLYDELYNKKNELLHEKLKLYENNIDKCNEIINTQKKIMDYCDEKFNPNKKKFKKKKNKIIIFDPIKKPCKSIITTTKNEIIYGRYCGNICEEKSDFCKNHLNKNNIKYDILVKNTCEHIITQKSGGKNGNKIVDRKGMKCNNFTIDFDFKESKYCNIHIKRHKDEKLEKINTELRTFKIRIYPNNKQIEKLKNFFGCVRKTYNICVKNNVYEKISQKEARKKYVIDIVNDENYKYLKDIPKDVREFALKEYYTNCKNSEDSYNLKIKNEDYKKETYHNYKTKNIKISNIGFKLKNDTQSINISKLSINIKNKIIIIYPNLLSSEPIKISQRQLKNDKKLNKIFNEGNNHDVKLIKTKTNKYYLCFSIDYEIKAKKENIKPISIDPNLRNLGVAYSENKCFEIGIEMYSHLIPMIKKRDELKRIYNKSIKDEIKGILTKENHEKNKMNYRKQEEKIENRINDLHYKVINKLITDGFTLILIPKLNIKQMLENNNMSVMTKKIAQIERHMKFINRLQERAKLEGVIVKIVNENMTTQCCGHCFSTKKFSEEIYNCDKCKNIFGRDINSARNIYIKELCKITEFIYYLSKL